MGEDDGAQAEAHLAAAEQELATGVDGNHHVLLEHGGGVRLAHMPDDGSLDQGERVRRMGWSG